MSAERLEAFDRQYKELIAKVRGQAGFEDGFVFLDRKSGKGLSITLWDSEESLRNGDAVFMQNRASVAQAVGVTNVQPPEVYEVISRTRKAPPRRKKTT
jgi:heme-degrading monooxygenase HmoA